MPEVRITHLHPLELRERRAQCALAWLPLGTIEWHGRHLPLGFDGVKAEAICVRGAHEIGGVVFPAQYYGDHRGVILESIFAEGILGFGRTRDHRVECCDELGVSVAGVTANAARDHERSAGLAHVELLERTFWMIRAYGFTRIVALAGHYPNASPAQIAAEQFHAKQTTCEVIWGHEGMLGDGGGDHAGAYETAQLMHFMPDLVHLDRLSGDRPEEPTGIHGVHPNEATAERGLEIVEAMLAGVRAKLGAVPPEQSIADPDEDNTPADWTERLRAGGTQMMSSFWK